MTSRIAALFALALSSLTALAGVTFIPKYSSNSNSVYGYQDPSTCLVWYRKPNVNGALKYKSAAAVQVGLLSLGGHTDWRFPTLAEFQEFNQSLNGIAPAAFVQGPFDPISPGQYWTSTEISVQVAAIDARTGFTVWHGGNGAAAYTWPVRYETCPSAVASPFGANKY